MKIVVMFGQIMGPSNFTTFNRQAFANQLDQRLANVKSQLAQTSPGEVLLLDLACKKLGGCWNLFNFSSTAADWVQPSGSNDPTLLDFNAWAAFQATLDDTSLAVQ